MAQHPSMWAPTSPHPHSTSISPSPYTHTVHTHTNNSATLPTHTYTNFSGLLIHTNISTTHVQKSTHFLLTTQPVYCCTVEWVYPVAVRHPHRTVYAEDETKSWPGFVVCDRSGWSERHHTLHLPHCSPGISHFCHLHRGLCAYSSVSEVNSHCYTLWSVQQHGSGHR